MNTRRQSLPLRTTLLVLMGILLVSTGGYFLYASLNAPKQALLKAPAEVRASAKKRTEKEKQEYSVPATHPRKLSIPKLGVDAAVLPMGKQATGELSAPTSAWDVGWYNESGLPGQQGAIVIDGHVNDALGSPGIFYRLSQLTAGDTLQVERGDRKTYEYTITKVAQLPISQIDMTALLSPDTGKTEGLNLITCGGVYDEAKKTYRDRVVAYAVRTE